ncbi:MAG: tRNA uridine(34) 5-carboxymethylaminomethyl modification radical SAM/GNAT enzyme Elp3 [Candidatus Nealsonbacteria bacterium]|nr:tRNA uridine(34) 5-carboxymethylaminomethyl modification radical SAM/GNAT enzyme Elp3 [Candidatus Nealsonbacteria bacterium]
MDILETIIRELINDAGKSGADLSMVKRRVAKKYKAPCPTNISLLRTYHKLVENKTLQASPLVKNLLITRPVRSLSGIVNISVLTKPYPCPGKCIYCPSQKGSPKSYLNNEPAVMRAILNKYDPYDQVKMRLRALEMTGHPTDKIELRIIGGTWSFYPKNYQTWFVKRCFDACNARGRSDISKAQKCNETARHRIVGLSIETRPDFITEKEIQRLRELGATMAELGVQSIYDDALKLIKRGHGRNETIRATKLLKDAGFKVCYQMMPNLPGANTLRDKKMFRELFSNGDFQPDMLKIYPCALLKEAPLYRWWKNKKYKPYTKHQLIALVKAIKKSVPPYVRIQRITRDIPSQSIIAGPAKLSNLRQMITGHCKCIRCREVKGDYNAKEKLFLFRRDYQASGGKEIFLTFENKNQSKLYSLLRLRVCVENGSRPFAMIREVHTFGQSLEVRPLKARLPAEGRTSPASPQHKGLGKKLLQEAEKISLLSGVNKIEIISGVGVRGYYRKLGYKLEKTYMTKFLSA